MASAAYKQKVRAQDALAIHQVQPLLEQLVCELTLTRPADPVAALLARLDELDVHDGEGGNKPTAAAAVQQSSPPPPSRVLRPRRLVCVYGVRGAGKTTQCAMAAAACNGVTLSPSKLLELAAKDCNSYGEDDKSCVLSSHHTTSNANKTRKRRAVRLPEQLQRAVQDVLARGQQQQQQHVSTELLTRLLVHYVTQLDDARHGDDGDDNDSHNDKKSTHAPVTFLLDDYPQTLEQALALEAQLGALSCAIELRCPAATARRRVTVHSSSLSSPSLAASRNNDNNVIAAAAEQSHGDTNDEAAVVARVQTLSEYWKARGVRRIVDAAQDTQACARTVRALLNE